MKLLAEISDRSLGLGDAEILEKEFRFRKSGRALLFNDAGEVATQYLRTYDYHKLPGGGVDIGETVEEGLLREIREEVGCACELGNPLGIVIEYRDKYKLLHISYGFVAKVVGAIGAPELEAEEIEEGQETVWMRPEELLEKMETDTPQKYEGHFHREREIAFLREYLMSGL